MQVTLALPLPAQAGAISRQLLVTTGEGLSHVYNVTIALASIVFNVPQNADVTVSLADVDSSGNLSKPTMLSFPAIAGAQLPAPAALAPPTVAAVPAYTPPPAAVSTTPAAGTPQV